jgi:hypothetical protein
LKEIKEKNEFNGVILDYETNSFSDETYSFSSFKVLFERLNKIKWRRLYIQPSIPSTINSLKRGFIIHNLIISNIVDTDPNYLENYQMISYQFLYFISNLVELDLKM